MCLANPSIVLRDRVKARAGFTLIELLVIGVILSALAALAAPVGIIARGRSHEVGCASNLRQWGVAFLLYAGDHDGFLPHPDDRRRDGGATGATSHPEHDEAWVDVLPPYFTVSPWRDFPAGKKPRGGVWQCPAVQLLPDSAYGYRPAFEGFHSYAMNSYLAHDFNYGLPWGAEPQPSFLNLAKAVAPGETILLFEQTLDPAQGYGQSGSFPQAGYHTAEDARAATERHARDKVGLGGNVLHLDGHVRWRNDLWDSSRRNPRMPARGDLTWFPYPY